MTNEKLIEIAKDARQISCSINASGSCSELSNYKVGVALLTKEGKVFTGRNIEDPSGIGVTNICAERCAVIKALSEGYANFTKIAVVGGPDELVFTTPCGVCRQYLNSVAPDIKIITLDNEQIREFTLAELLPHSFNEKFEK